MTNKHKDKTYSQKCEDFHRERYNKSLKIWHKLLTKKQLKSDEFKLASEAMQYYIRKTF